MNQNKKCTERLSTYTICGHYKDGLCGAGKTCSEFYDKGEQPEGKMEVMKPVYVASGCTGCKWEHLHGKCLMCSRNFNDEYTRQENK
jgi:hypothetical protein